MNAASKSRILFVLLVSLCISSPLEARFRRGWSYPSGPNGWHGGYWFHGSYLGYAGWWWVVGPYWYYYPNPDGSPVYVVQVDSAPPQGTNSSLPPPPGAMPSSLPEPPPAALPSTTASPLSSPPLAPGQPVALPSGEAGTGSPTKAFMYYCEKTKSYYPLISTCTEGWIVTPVKPPH